jgi:hypothetical protein
MEIFICDVFVCLSVVPNTILSAPLHDFDDSAVVHKSQATKFFTLVPHTFGIIINSPFSLHAEMCICSRALSRTCQITVRFTDQPRIVGPQYGTCIMSPVWRLRICRWLLDFWKICGPLMLQ